MRAHNDAITVGTDVKFDSDAGIQQGKVCEIKGDVTNGRRIAAVHVAGSLDNQPWHVPVDQLQHVGASA
jgi:hypothetical protein